MNEKEFPIPFSGIEWCFDLNEAETLKVITALITHASACYHNHNFAVQSATGINDVTRIYVSDTAKNCVFKLLGLEAKSLE